MIENLTTEQLRVLTQHAERAGDEELEALVEAELVKRLRESGREAGSALKRTFDRLAAFFAGFNEGAGTDDGK